VHFSLVEPKAIASEDGILEDACRYPSDTGGRTVGLISNQWLNRGQGVRNRGYYPVPISALAEVCTDEWSKRREVVVEITARDPDTSQFQVLFLSQPEAEQTVHVLAEVCSKETRSHLVLQLLKSMTDTELLKALASDLNARTKG
jgi:hypothetical protein